MRRLAHLDDLSDELDIELLEVNQRADAELGVGFCPECRGARYIVPANGNPIVCEGCGGDGLAPQQLGSIADAARLSVPWLA